MVVDFPIEVLTVKWAVVAPAGTVTVSGTLKLTQSILSRVMTAPPAGAGEVNVTVPVVVPPKRNVAGLNVRAASEAGGFKVSVAARAMPL